MTLIRVLERWCIVYHLGRHTLDIPICLPRNRHPTPLRSDHILKPNMSPLIVRGGSLVARQLPPERESVRNLHLTYRRRSDENRLLPVHLSRFQYAVLAVSQKRKPMLRRTHLDLFSNLLFTLTTLQSSAPCHRLRL